MFCFCTSIYVYLHIYIHRIFIQVLMSSSKKQMYNIIILYMYSTYKMYSTYIYIMYFPYIYIYNYIIHVPNLSPRSATCRKLWSLQGLFHRRNLCHLQGNSSTLHFLQCLGLRKNNGNWWLEPPWSHFFVVPKWYPDCESWQYIYIWSASSWAHTSRWCVKPWKQ